MSDPSASPPGSNQWDQVAAHPEFRSLLRDKARFIIPCTVFFILYYFALPILVGYFPELMKRRVFGPVNVAYLFALSQFIMTWALAAVYMRQAARFDKREHAITSTL